jgi:hypothetical protein
LRAAPKLHDGRSGGAAQARIIGQSEVIVGRKVDQSLAGEFNRRALRAGNPPQLSI